jgi:integral membrane protein (TIGR00529 family)
MPLVKLGLVFFVIIYLTRKKCPLGYAMLIGSGLLGVIFGMGGLSILRSAGKACVDLTTLELASIVALIIILSSILEEKGQLQRILASLQVLIRNVKVLLIVLPALIGLLPMPGGALFSAPMVKIASRRLKLTAVQHTAINYWFRHVWEYCLPLYPAIVLASKLSGVTLPRLALAQLPLTAIMLLSGAFFYLRGLQGSGDGNVQFDRKGNPALESDIMSPSGHIVFHLFIDALPILLVIVLALCMGINLVIALAVSIAVAIALSRSKVKDVARLILKNIPLNMIILVFGIMVFKVMLRDCGSIEDVAVFLKTHHVPVILMFALLPFLTGILTGFTVGLVGITFPIAFALLGAEGSSTSHAVLAYGMGFVGVLLSPVHLCLLVTKDYFKAQFDRVYRSLLMPVVPIVGMVIFLFLVY